MRTGSWVLRLAMVAVVGASVTTALAQPQGQGRRGGGGRGGFGNNPLLLLRNETVQKHLELSDDQKSQVTKLAEEQQGQGGGRRGGGGGGGADFAQRQEELRKKVNDILLPNQQERLAQISLQVRGAAQALVNDEKLAEKLTLSADQKQKLTALNEEYQQKRRDARQNAGGGGGGGGFGNFNSPEMQQLTKEENE